MPTKNYRRNDGAKKGIKENYNERVARKHILKYLMAKGHDVSKLTLELFKCVCACVC